MDTSAFWKKIWCTITGQSKYTTAADIKKVLDHIKNDLHNGISIFKPYTIESFNHWKTTINKPNVSNGLELLIRKLSETLNLETLMTWKVFCNFLMFEYYGTIADIERTAEFEIYNASLFEQIWLFYSSERMYLLKSWRYIIESCLNENHKFYDLYIDFIIKIRVGDLRRNLLSQFEILLNEINSDNCKNCNDFKDWVNRNIQEQIEVLCCIITSQEYITMSLDEFKDLFLVFRSHNFTHDPSYYQISEVANPDDVKRIRWLEIIALVNSLQQYWKKPTPLKPFAEDTETLLMTAIYDGDLCIFMLAWSTLQLTSNPRAARDKFNTHYSKFTKAALKEDVFVLMYNILADPIMKVASIFRIIQKTLYNLLDYVCENFDDDGSIVMYNGVVNLAVELIKNKDLATKFVKHENTKAGVIYTHLYEMFPYFFEGFSEIVYQLLQHEHLFQKLNEKQLKKTKDLGREVITIVSPYIPAARRASAISVETKMVTLITYLKHYTEEYNERVAYMDDEVTLMRLYNVTENIAVNAHTNALIFKRHDKGFVRYETSYNYFTLLEDKVNETLLRKHIPDCSLKDIELGYKILDTLVKGDYVDDAIRIDLDVCSKMLLCTSKKPYINHDVMKVCLDNYVTLMKHNSEQILEVLSIHNFLPLLTKSPNDVKNYFDKDFLNPNILLLAISEQHGCGKTNLLFTYINMLKNTPKTKENTLRVEIPGLVFLFLHLFPAHLDWVYKNTNDKYDITLICLQFLLDILTKNYNNILDNSDKVVYDFCYCLAVNYEPTVSVLLRIFRTSNMYLHTRMLRVVNWDAKSTCTIINCLKICMHIFMRLFTLHNNGERSLEGTHFYTKFLDSKPSSLKVLIGYLNHAFDTAVPKLACQLVKKIAHNPTIPVLALLEMDHYQIQSAFLEKLRDPLESESIKIAILELITLSIEKQNGLTAAFFDLRKHLSLKGDSKAPVGDSIVAFMEEYLENIKKSTSYLNSPVQAAVLDLFHTLWMYRKDILVQHLTKGITFWYTLMDPLFNELKLPNKTYSQLFNILTFELFKNKGQNDQINNILEKLFSEEKSKFTQKWCDHIIMSLEENSLVTSGNALLHSWKNLIMAVIIAVPNCIQGTTVQSILTETCINGLIQHFAYLDDIRILINWAELYLFLIKHCSKTYFKDHKEVFTTLTRLFKYVAEYYDDIGNELKETMLSIAIQTLNDLYEFVSESAELVEDYLYSVGAIFEKEYTRIMCGISQPNEKSYSHWVLLIIFGNNLILKDFVRTHETWFWLKRFGYKIMTSLQLFIKNPIYFPIAKVAVQCLINYARTNMLKEFLNIDFDEFFDYTRPPKRIINTDELSLKNALPWNFEEWWLIYIGIVEFMTILLENPGLFDLNIFFSFLTIHDDIFKNSLKLPKVTVERTALQLTQVCLNFCKKIMSYRQEWKGIHPNVYSVITDSIYETLNTVTCIFLRPKILKFFVINLEDSSLNLLGSIPIDLIVNIMDELIKIVSLSCLCLLEAGPSLLSLSQPFYLSTNDVDIEFDFHIPQVCIANLNRITYGTILCLLNFLCRTITYILTQKLPTPKKQDNSLEGDEDTGNNMCLAFVCPDYAGGYTISERYNSLSSQGSGLSSPWLAKLNLTNVTFALETLSTLIGVQTYLSLTFVLQENITKQHLKRELWSELMYLYEFTRKRFVETYQYRIQDTMIFRKLILPKLPYNFNLSKTVPKLYARILTTDLEIIGEECDDKSEISFSDDDSILEGVINYGKLDQEIFFTGDDFVVINPKTPGPGGVTNTWETCYSGRKIVDRRTFKVPIQEVVMNYPTAPPSKEGDFLIFLMHWLMYFCDFQH